MKKNIVQDIVPPSKKSIRNIEIPSRRQRIEIPKTEPIVPKSTLSAAPSRPLSDKPTPTFDYSAVLEKPADKPVDKPVSESIYKYEYDEPKKSSKKILYAVLIVFVLAFAFGVSALFKSAEITVAPKQQSVHLNSNFTANKNDTVNLSFQIVTIGKDIQKTVPGNGQANVQEKASGTVVIFNTTGNSQKLVATTRLQTPEGLIFRINSAVTVPAAQNTSTPGSVSVTATADAAGDKYNVGLKDFTIPGLKGTAKYTQIYARSKTAMAGGFSGMQAVISPQNLASTSAEMQNDLQTSLTTDIVSQIPANFILYKNSMSFSFDPISQASTTGSGAVLDEKGTAYGVIFDRGSLSRTIAALHSITDPIKIDNLDALDFEYASSTPFDPSSNQSTVSFSLTGDVNIVWVFDANKLKTELLGLSKNQAKTVISGYPAISEAWIEIHPFWNQTIPSNPQKVNLLTK
jgi:hypothetical protein